jgi:hypothetical protein
MGLVEYGAYVCILESAIRKCRDKTSRVGQNCIYTPYMTLSGDFPAKNTIYTPCIPIHVWFWPTLKTSCFREWQCLGSTAKNI